MVALSRFLRVRCECGNEQNVFGSPAMEVSCLVCAKPLLKPGGAKGVLAGKTKVVRTL